MRCETDDMKTSSDEHVSRQFVCQFFFEIFSKKLFDVQYFHEKVLYLKLTPFPKKMG